MGDVKFDALNLVAHDMDATLAFYRRLGFEIPEEIVWRGSGGLGHVDTKIEPGVGLDFDTNELAHVYNKGFDPERAEARTLLGFRVSSRVAVDERYADLTGAGYKGVQPPYDTFWGARYAIVEDPDARQVGIMSPVDPERRTAPPSV